MTQPFLGAFMGTSVEFFETSAIAYALVAAGHRREAISATIAGHAIIVIAAIFLWPLRAMLPITWLHLLAASLLTLTGVYWTAKSVKRLLSGRRPDWVTDPLGRAGGDVLRATTGFSIFVFVVMLKSSIVEAAEILLVVFPIAASTGARTQIAAGVATGIATVAVVPFVLHGQLKKVPEVKLKLATGILLAAIGISWLHELR